MYTLEQIKKVWLDTYGEDMKHEYQGFLQNLVDSGNAKEFVDMIDCEQEAVSIVWEYVSEKDIPEINERLDKLNKEGK